MQMTTSCWKDCHGLCYQTTAQHIYAIERIKALGNEMRRLILLLLILLSIAFLANSMKPISLTGNGGLALLNGLTNGSGDANNTTVNISNRSVLIPLSGNNGTELLNNVSKSPANLSFGSTPRKPPVPVYDPKLEQEIEILRANHIGY